MDTKQCQMCKITKPVAEFYKSKQSKTGYCSYCRDCKLEANKRSDSKRLTENREKFLDQRKNWHLKRVFGITLDEYRGMLKKQNEVCAICLKKDTGKMLAVDHCHKTKVIRGLLCQKCNRAIGQLDDDIQRLNRAIGYLTGTRYIKTPQSSMTRGSVYHRGEEGTRWKF